MRAFLKGVKPDTYFAKLASRGPEHDPHDDAFVKKLLGGFERDLLSDAAAWKAVSENILSHVKIKDGKYSLSGLNLYEPEEKDMEVMLAAYKASSPYWLVPARVYKAVISRDLAKRQGRISRGVSTRTLEDCAERIAYNVGVLLVNEDMMQGDLTDRVCDLEFMFPRLKGALAAIRPDVGNELAKGGRLAQDVSFALWWYYMVSSSFVGPENPHFPVSDTDRDDTWARIQDMLNTLGSDPSDDELIVFINRFIDLCHGRGSLAGAFVEGGAATCAAVSNMGADELYEAERRS